MDLIQEDVKSEPKCDMCKCLTCDNEMKVEDCSIEAENYGREYPTYYYHICPHCEDGGCIEDYWSSKINHLI